MNEKYITVQVEDGAVKTVPTVTQYDYGRILRIVGLALPAAAEAHFYSDGAQAPLTVAAVEQGGATIVPLPDSLLCLPFGITAFLYVDDGESGVTVHRIDINMVKRPEPATLPADPEDPHYVSGLSALITAAAEAAEKADAAAETATASAAAAQAISDTLTPADAHYDPESWVAQSGVAVAEGIAQSQQFQSHYGAGSNFTDALHYLEQQNYYKSGYITSLQLEVMQNAEYRNTVFSDVTTVKGALDLLAGYTVSNDDRVSRVESALVGVDLALDSIIALQESYIGGGAE